MRLIKLIFIILLLSLSSVYSSNNLVDLISRGKLVQARDSLSRISTAASRDGDILFCRGILQADGDEAARMLEASLKASATLDLQEDAYYYLAQYYYLKGEMSSLEKMIMEYRNRWENGKYDSPMRRFSFMVDEKKKAYESAIKQIDRYLLEYSDNNITQMGLVDKARLMGKFKKIVAATKLLKKLSRNRSGPGVAPALYFLTANAIHSSNTDDAVFYYNVLRESFPSAIGLDALVDMMSAMDETVRSDNAAEELTNTFYSVQVGVFSEKKNAEKKAKLLEQYGHKVEIKTRTISGNKYRVVFIGHFNDYLSARQFKETLEKAQGESYLVIAR